MESYCIFIGFFLDGINLGNLLHGFPNSPKTIQPTVAKFRPMKLLIVLPGDKCDPVTSYETGSLCFMLIDWNMLYWIFLGPVARYIKTGHTRGCGGDHKDWCAFHPLCFG